jgi:hypothetical protein
MMVRRKAVQAISLLVVRCERLELCYRYEIGSFA